MLGGELQQLLACIPRFVDLCGRSMWSRRLAHLHRELSASPFRGKIVADYHWLEVVLGAELECLERSEPCAPVAIEVLAAMYFAQTVLHAHEHLTTSGRKQLEGRLHDALQSDVGFSPLYLEMEVARLLLDAGYQVEFADMDRTAQYDLRFWKKESEGEVECKSLSADAGRKVHRRDFYRFIDAIARKEVPSGFIAREMSVLAASVDVLARPPTMQREPSPKRRRRPTRVWRRMLRHRDLRFLALYFFALFVVAAYFIWLDRSPMPGLDQL